MSLSFSAADHWFKQTVEKYSILSFSTSITANSLEDLNLVKAEASVNTGIIFCLKAEWQSPLFTFKCYYALRAIIFQEIQKRTMILQRKLTTIFFFFVEFRIDSNSLEEGGANSLCAIPVIILHWFMLYKI